MKFKEAVKDTNKALLKALKHDHWELKEAFEFYKQSFDNFWYATRNLLTWIGCFLLLFLVPFFYPVAVIIRMVKK